MGLKPKTGKDRWGGGHEIPCAGDLETHHIEHKMDIIYGDLL